ncbi:MAG: hypothetical protein WCX69_05880 [Candidatus Paceibacterota bacterium]
MNKIVKEIINGLKAIGKGVVVILLIVIVVGVGYNFWNAKTAIYRIPSNLNVVIQPNEDLSTVLPQGFENNDYTEISFNSSDDPKIWMPLCYGAIGYDDAADVCRAFKKGYLREYKSYKSVSWRRPAIYINEYETENDAKQAATFLIIDGYQPLTKIDGVGVIGKDMDDFGGGNYTLVTGKYLITTSGNQPAKELMQEVIRLHKK